MDWEFLLIVSKIGVFCFFGWIVVDDEEDIVLFFKKVDWDSFVINKQCMFFCVGQEEIGLENFFVGWGLDNGLEGVF